MPSERTFAREKPTSRRGGLLVAGVVVAALVLALFGTNLWSGAVAAPSAPAVAVVTEHQFAQSREGMQYADVAKLLGSPGKTVAVSYIGGYETSTFEWENPDGSKMQATFARGSLMSKSQTGLH